MNTVLSNAFIKWPRFGWRRFGWPAIEWREVLNLFRPRSGEVVGGLYISACRVCDLFRIFRVD